MNIERMYGESDFDYHKRLVYGKLVDRTLADIDYSELSEPVYGKSYSSDVARRMMYGSAKTLALLDELKIKTPENNATPAVLSEIDSRIMELQKEKQKFYDQRAALNKLLRERSRQEELNEILTSAVRDGDLPSLCYIPNDVPDSDNDLLVSLNDIHYGMVVDNAWNKYDPDVFGEMLCNYLDKIIEIGARHKSENCYIFSNGDAISGMIHRTIQIANKENVIRQIKGVSELIAEFLAELSKHFASVRFASVAGNHSRLNSKEDSPIDERLDDLIEWYLSARLQNFDNIVIGCQEKIDSTMYLLDVRGKLYCGVHGDFDDSPVKVAALQAMAGGNVYAVLCGHKHHNMVDEVQGVKIVMAGGFVGMDDYCIQKRIYGKPEQMICVCDSTGIVCHYDIELHGGMRK